MRKYCFQLSGKALDAHCKQHIHMTVDKQHSTIHLFLQTHFDQVLLTNNKIQTSRMKCFYLK